MALRVRSAGACDLLWCTARRRLPVCGDATFARASARSLDASRAQHTAAKRPAYDILFCGSDRFSELVLKRLLQERELIRSIEILTSSDVAERQTWGGSRMKKSPVKALAEQNGIKCSAVGRDRKLSSYLPPWAESSDSPLLITASFGCFVPRSFLAAWTRLGAERAVNVHPSLLPRLRGAAPIPWAIAASFSPDAPQEGLLGVTIQDLSSKGFDRGRVLHQEALPAEVQRMPWRYEQALTVLASGGGEALVRVMRDLERCATEAREQDERLVTLAPKLDAGSHATIDWHSMTAEEIDARHRGFSTFFPLRCSLVHRQQGNGGAVDAKTLLYLQQLRLVPRSLLLSAPPLQCKKGMHSAPSAAAALEGSDVIPGTAVFCAFIPALAAEAAPTPGLVVKCTASHRPSAEEQYLVIEGTRLDGRKGKIVNEDWWNGFRPYADDKHRLQLL